MTQQRHERLKAIFAEVCKLTPSARSDRLDELCANDDDLRTEVESLLGHDNNPAIDFDGAAQGLRVDLTISHTQPSHGTPFEQIGQYQVQSILGEGGMGVVYLAEQESPRRTVALKLIRPGTASPSILRRFTLESDLLGRLQHPAIAQIFEVGTADVPGGTEQPYFTMEYVPGEPLNRHAKRRSLSRDDRVRLLIKVCAGVQHAHQNGIIHRDLKPSNIIVSEMPATAGGTDTPLLVGQPKILDFGVARSITAEDRTVMTQVGEIVGTMAYMSPEQSAGRAHEVDARSDVYSLGVIAYELLSGQLPFDTRDDALVEAARRIAEDSPPRLSSISRSLRGDLETIIGKAIEKDPARRYQSASEFAADLDRYLNSEPVLARPPSAIYQMHKFARRHRGFVTAVTALMVVVTVGAAVSTAGWVRARSENVRANMEQDTTLAVNDFLTTMLASADPNSTADPDLPVRVVLDQAAVNLDGTFPDRPLIRAELHATIGRTYSALAVFEEAREHLSKALAIREQHLGTVNEKVSDVLHDLMIAYKQDNLFPEALEYATRLADVDEALHGPGHLTTLNSRIQRALMLTMLGRFDEAEAIFEPTLRTWRQIEPEGSSEYAVALNEYGLYLADLGEYERSEQAHRESLALHQQHDGVDSLPTALAHVNLAAALHSLRRSDKALEHLEHCRRIRTARLKPDHFWLTSLHRMEGTIHQQIGNIDAAIAAYQRSINALRERRPDGDISLALALKSLADIRSTQARHDEAIELAEEALRMIERDLGSTHMYAAVILNSIATDYSAVGRMDDAKGAMNRCIAIARELYGESSERLAHSLYTLSQLHISAGEFELARETLVEGSEMLAVCRPDDPIGLSHFESGLAIVAGKLGDLPAARERFERVLELRRPHLQPDHPSIAATLQNIGAIQRMEDNFAGAEINIREALRIYDVITDGPHPQKAACLVVLGSVLRDNGSPGDAEPVLRNARTMRQGLYTADSLEVAEANLELGICLRELDQPDEAESMLRAAWDVLHAETSPEQLRESCAKALADVLESRGAQHEAESLGLPSTDE